MAAHLPEASPPAADTSVYVEPPVAVPDTLTLTRMRNVHFRIDDAIALRIRDLRGTASSTRNGEPINFGDKRSFLIDIHFAEVGLSARDLSILMNRYVFAYPGAPLKDLWITTEGDQIKQVGIMHKVIDIPFEIIATMTATPEGMIRMHPTSIKICSLPGEGLMEALGIQLDELLDLSQAQGVSVEKNDLLLDPKNLLPPPAIRGHVTAVRIEGDEVIQTFGSPDDSLSQVVEQLARPNPTAANYLFFRGGTLRFGKLFMVQADLQIIDEAPDTPFDFYIDRYVEQLVAGYSKTTPDFGLEAYMPDFETLEAATKTPARPDSSGHCP